MIVKGKRGSHLEQEITVHFCFSLPKGLFPFT